METRPLTISEVANIAYVLAREIMDWDEHIPDFSTRYPKILESCLNTPFASFGGVDLYPTLISKAAILFYLIIKNHPFQNGNKRLAVASTLVFLFVNKKWIEVPHEFLYKIAIAVAESEPAKKDVMIKALNNFFEEHISELKD